MFGGALALSKKCKSNLPTAPSRLGHLPHKILPIFNLLSVGGAGGEKCRCKRKKAPSALRHSQLNRALTAYGAPRQSRVMTIHIGERRFSWNSIVLSFQFPNGRYRDPRFLIVRCGTRRLQSACRAPG